MKRLITITAAAVLFMSLTVPLLAKEKSTSGSTGYCVTTGNGRTQMVGGKSGERSQKGLRNAASHSKSVRPSEKVPK